MSTSVLLLILLSVPGLMARFAWSTVMRVMQRRNRDLVTTVSLLVPVSLLLLTTAYFILQLPCIDNLTCDPTISTALRTLDFELAPQAVLPLLAVASGLGFAVGGALGKLRLWRLGPDSLTAHPLDALAGGTTRPLVGAVVLTTTSIGEKLLIYSGRLHAIQIGPDGTVDFVVLSGAIKKSLLAEGPHISTQPAGYPVTVKPFLRVEDAESQSHGKTVRTDRLIIESDDIANIHLELYSDVQDGDWFDRKAYVLGRRLGFINAEEPEPPS